ncbi:acylphosphatase [Candidatus Micrarchaeota archaeon RBG_16_36_9]|nr:MAG: acylphosphatase [Candidatus Micrarchaeota archaeon RBG_16_36_9]
MTLLKLTRAHVIVSGDVQGISFRYYTKQKAIILGINGWIKNLVTGEVEAVFEGLDDRIKEMVEWCKKGPWLAKVNNVKVEFSDYRGEFEVFEIRY